MRPAFERLDSALAALPLVETPVMVALPTEEQRVTRIQRIESVLRTFGLRTFRVRFHTVESVEMVRIEVGADELGVLVQEGVRDAIVGICKQEGFRWVTLDLEGYRMGGLSHRPKPPTA